MSEDTATIPVVVDPAAVSGVLEERRRDQERQWVWQLVREQLEERFRRDPRVATLLPELEAAVACGEVPAVTAARRLLAAFDDS